MRRFGALRAARSGRRERRQNARRLRDADAFRERTQDRGRDPVRSAEGDHRPVARRGAVIPQVRLGVVALAAFAVVGPVPVAVIGLGGSLALLTVGLWRLSSDTPEWTATAAFGLSLAATLYVAYLTYLELFVIGAVCPWCVSVAIAVVGVFVLTVLELRSG